MTREEAINVMQKYTDIESGISKVVAEAHEIAIKALEQEQCEDCISRKAAKRIIFDEFEGWPTDEEVTQLKRLTRQFNDLPSIRPEPKTEWIPVSERLPENDGDVLVQMNDCSMMVDFIAASSSGWFWAEKDDLPIAWMPLPEPYEESEG